MPPVELQAFEGPCLPWKQGSCQAQTGPWLQLGSAFRLAGKRVCPAPGKKRCRPLRGTQGCPSKKWELPEGPHSAASASNLGVLFQEQEGRRRDRRKPQAAKGLKPLGVAGGRCAAQKGPPVSHRSIRDLPATGAVSPQQKR